MITASALIQYWILFYFLVSVMISSPLSLRSATVCASLTSKLRTSLRTGKILRSTSIPGPAIMVEIICENCKEALRQAEREREKIIQLMLNGQLTDVNVPLFNARLESASKEVDHLTDRLKNLQIECNSIGYDPERAILFIREIETLADLMARLPDDFEKQRRILVMHIKEIAEQPDGSFRFYFNFEPLNSSTICQLWLRQLDSNQRPSG